MSRMLKRSKGKDAIPSRAPQQASSSTIGGGARKLSKDALGRLGKLMGKSSTQAASSAPQTYSLNPVSRPGSGPGSGAPAVAGARAGTGAGAGAGAGVGAGVGVGARAGPARVEARSASVSGTGGGARDVSSVASKLTVASKPAIAASQASRGHKSGGGARVRARVQFGSRTGTRGGGEKNAIMQQLQKALVISSTHGCYRHDAPRYQPALHDLVQSRGRGRSVLAARAKAADAASKKKLQLQRAATASKKSVSRGTQLVTRTGKPIVLSSGKK